MKINRREFTKIGATSSLALLLAGYGCSGSSVKTTKDIKSTKDIVTSDEPFFQLSLAQWSLHKEHWEGKLDLFDFAKKSKQLGFTGLEYVSGLYYDWLKEQTSEEEGLKIMTDKLLASSEEYGMKNLLIMIDNQGDLGVQDEAKRLKGVEMHKKWIDMAKALGCHSIRVNLFGDGTPEEQIKASADSMKRLGEYGADKGIYTLVENHGGQSSNPEWVKAVIETADTKFIGTLPDFGNFCIEREGGERWGAPCINEYPDYYKAVETMMPYAQAVSAKSYAFDENGNETKIDYKKMLKVVKDAGYKGYIGVEYEGEDVEENGIIATRDLLIKAAKEI